MAKKTTTQNPSVAEELLGLAERKDERARLTLRLKESVKERLESAAADNGLTVNAYINNVLMADLRKNGYL